MAKKKTKTVSALDALEQIKQRNSGLSSSKSGTSTNSSSTTNKISAIDALNRIAQENRSSRYGVNGSSSYLPENRYGFNGTAYDYNRDSEERKARELAMEQFLSQFDSDEEFQYYQNVTNARSESQKRGETGEEWYKNAQAQYQTASDELNAAKSAASKASILDILGDIGYKLGLIDKQVDTSSTKEATAKAAQNAAEAEKQLEYSNYFKHSDYATDPDYQKNIASGKEKYKTIDQTRSNNFGATSVQDYINAGYPEWAAKAMHYLTFPGATEATSAGEAVTSYNASQRANYEADNTWREPTDKWTDEELNTYYYLLGRGENTDEADDYAQSVNEKYNSETYNAQQKKAQEFATAHPVLGTAAAVGSSLLSTGSFINASNEQAARGTVTQKANMDIADYSSAMESAIAESLNNKSGEGIHSNNNVVESILEWTGLAGKKWGDAYQLGTSLLQSWGSIAAGGEVGSLGMFFGSAAYQTMKDAMNRGVDSADAVTLGALAGLAEVAGEMFSVENLVNGINATSWKTGLQSALQQAGIEGSEEGLTTLMNRLSDAMVNGDKSELTQYMNSLMAQGMSYEEANKATVKEFVSGILSDMIGGAISGGLSAGAKIGGSLLLDSVTTASPIRTMQAMQYGQLAGEDVRQTYDKAQETLKTKGKISNYTANKLMSAATESIQKQDTNILQSAVESRLTELGETSDVKTVAKAIAENVVSGETAKNLSIVSASKYGTRVSNELDTAKIESGEYQNPDWVKNIHTKVTGGEHYRAAITQPMAKSGTVSTTGKTTANGKTITDYRVSSVNSDGSYTFTDKSGKEYKQSEIKFSNNDEAVIYQRMQNLGIKDVNTVNFVYDGYKASNLSLTEYVNGITSAYRYGSYGEGLWNDASSEKSAASALPESIRRSVFNTAVKENADKTKAAQKAVEENKGNERIKGSVKYHFDKNKKLNAKQKSGVDVSKFISNITGRDVNLFESKEVDGTFYILDENGEIAVDEKGKKILAPHGWIDEDGTIWIDINSGMDSEGIVLNTLGHEMAHFIRMYAQDDFRKFADFLLGQMSTVQVDGKNVSIDSLISRQISLAESKGRTITVDEALEEVVANACDTFLNDGTALHRIAAAENDATLNKVYGKDFFRKLRHMIENFIKKIESIINAYKGVESESAEGQIVNMLGDVKTKLEEMYADAFVTAARNASTQKAVEEVNADIDTKTESANPSDAQMFSERTWTESQYVQAREQAAKELAEALDITEKKAKDYIDSINSIAKAIADDRTRLDYYSAPGLSAFVSNAEYGGSFDFSTLCKKRRLMTGTFEAIQKALPNTALTADEILKIRNMMKEKGLEVSCGLCYVEGSRANMGQFTQEFIKLYKKYYPGQWTPNMFEMNTPDGIENVRVNHPEVYEQYEYFWNHYGTLREGDPNLFASQQKPKLYQLRTEYKNEIIKNFKGDNAVEAKNRNGGVRLQSFSDFEIVHAIDVMQIIMDMSKVGLAGQAYTKVPEFAWILGNTGLKINLSLIAKDVDANGKLIFDDVEGMNHDTAFKIRNNFSKNVGTILVVFTDKQLSAAMADDRIDFIIPFHRSQWKKSQYGAMGLPENTKDFTYMQNEKWLHPSEKVHIRNGKTVKTKVANYMPNEYWDFNLSGKENAERYLEMCAEDGKRPKFYKLLDNNGDGSFSLKEDGSTDGYWKLLIDFKMYDNDGVGSPQMPVRPEFNIGSESDPNSVLGILHDYQGGHQQFPVAHGIVDEFVKQYKEDHPGRMYSDRNIKDTVEGNEIVAFSQRVTDPNTLEFLNEQEKEGRVVHTFKSFQIIDGKLYPPMAAKTKGDDGKYHLANAMAIGEWEESVGDPKNIKIDPKNGKPYFVLNKGDGKSITASYNPYQHSSNLVLNDQFEGAYQRPNLVTFECIIPESELTSGYHAEYAKDAVGMHDWKAGVVAGKMSDNKRKVYLSRWLKPIRQLSDAEVAKEYKKLLSKDNIAVPFNVVSPGLLAELEKIGVPIDYEGSPMYKAAQARKQSEVKFHDRFSPEAKSIKEQIKENATKLNSISAVANINVNDLPVSRAKQRIWIMNRLKNTGYSIQRKDLGTILFENRHINEGLNYLSLDGEIAALAALPLVLKRGIIIDQHESHKSRKRDSITIAAPVIINGVRGNMAAVVTVTTKQHYHTHRILLPDGSAFTFENNSAETRPTEVTASNAESSSMVPANNDNISQESNKGKRNLSDRYSRDAQAAVDHFGTTENFYESGYILADGQMLDFSGRHWGLSDDQASGRRDVDHEDIYEVLNRSGDNRLYFINEGNIRFSPEAPGINLSANIEPTAEQYDRIREFLRQDDAGQFYVDFEGKKADRLQYSGKVNADKVITDMKHYYKTGEARQQSPLAAFYSERYQGYSTRELLANALMDASLTDTEMEYVSRYQDQIDKLDAAEDKIQSIDYELENTQMTSDRRTTLQNQKKVLQDQIQRYDEKLLKLKATTPLKNVLNRKVEQAIAREQETAQERLTQQQERYQERLENAISRGREHSKEVRSAEKARANERVAKAVQEGKDKVKEVRKEMREQRDEKVLQQKLHDKEVRERADQRRSDSKVRSKIKKLINDLNGRISKPSENHYVPVPLMRQTIDILEMIDMDTGRSQTIKDKIAVLKTTYDSLKQNPTYAIAYDQMTSDMLQTLSEIIGDTPLKDMNSAQLEAVYQTLKSLNHVITNAVKVKIGNEERNAFEVSLEMTKETRAVQKVKKGILNKYLQAQLRADNMFARLGGHKKNSTWSQVARMLDDGQLKQTQISMDLSLPFSEIVNDEKALKEYTSTKEKDLIDIGLKDENGDPILVNHDIMVGIYMDLLNEDNTRHLIYGGKTIPDLKSFYSQKNDNGFGIGARRAVGVSSQLSQLQYEARQAKQSGDMYEVDNLKQQIEDLRLEGQKYAEDLKKTIEENLTDYDWKWIRATQNLMDVQSKQYLNETTMDVYGIEKASVDNYFPITTDKNYINAPFETITKDMNLENAGFMKSRVPASNPTMAMGVFSVVNSQIDRVSQYCGLMPAIRTFNKIYNKTQAGYADSLKNAITDKFGMDGTKWIENLISDLTGSRKSGTNAVDQLLAGLRGNLAQSTLTMNVRVSLAQAASYPSAAAVVGWKPLIRALLQGGKNGKLISRADTELIKQYSPLLWYRMKGFSTVELGDIRKSQRLGSKIWNKLRWATGWIQAVDGATVGRLWYAAEYYVQDKYSNLDKGTDEYYKKVAEVFNDVVEKTQPNYTTMQRAAILREPSTALKLFTMFYTQRLQNTNIMYDAAATYQKYRQDFANGKNEVTAQDVKQAKINLAEAVSSQIVAAVTIVGFKAFADVLTHSMNAYRDDDDELTKESVTLALINNFVDSLVSNLAGGSELKEVIEAIIKDEKYYGLSVSGVDSVTDLVDDVISWRGDWSNGEKAFEVASSLCQCLGIPLRNAYKIAEGIKLHIEDIESGTQIVGEDGTIRKTRGGGFGSFEAGTIRTKHQNASILYEALQNGDTDKIQTQIGTFDDESDAKSYMKNNYLKDEYLDGKIGAEEVSSTLEYFGYDEKYAEALPAYWDFKENHEDFDLTMDNLGTELNSMVSSGEITKAEADTIWKGANATWKKTYSEWKSGK